MRAAPAADGRPLVRPPALGRRRPVLSFVGVIALVAVVLLAVGRSGLTVPQAAVQTVSSTGDGTTTCGTVYTVVNHGLRPVEVLSVTAGGPVWSPPPGVDLRTIGTAMAVDPRTLPPFAPMTVPRDGHTEIVVGVSCAEGSLFEPEVHVRSVDLGLRRTLHPS
ncbi:MAG TPA: hypothetical protein VFU19_16530 [Iamia sp.]|nr:hypothetical protein [Iamia sp.]